MHRYVCGSVTHAGVTGLTVTAWLHVRSPLVPLFHHCQAGAGAAFALTGSRTRYVTSMWQESLAIFCYLSCLKSLFHFVRYFLILVYRLVGESVKPHGCHSPADSSYRWWGERWSRMSTTNDLTDLMLLVNLSVVVTPSDFQNGPSQTAVCTGHSNDVISFHSRPARF